MASNISYFTLFFFLMFQVPDLETVDFKVLSRNDQYEIREVEVRYWLFFFLFYVSVFLLLKTLV